LLLGFLRNPPSPPPHQPFKKKNLLAKFRQKTKLKKNREKEMIFFRLSVARSEKKKKRKRFKNFRLHIFSFSLCSQKYKKTIKDFSTLFLIYRQIWLNIHMDDRHFLATNKNS
jgi:hypothetical protein